MSASPTLPVYDYQLVIRPAEHVRKRLDHARKRIVQQMLPLGQWQSGKNHIPVASFSQYAKNEEKLTELLYNLARSLPPFLFQVQHYGAVLHHTLYFNLLPAQGFSQLIQMLNREKLSMKVINQEPRIATFPKINVAYKLNPSEFEHAWHALKNKKIHLRFIAENVLLLRKRPAETKWQIIASLPFENLPVSVNQGQLFG
jgi:2'-5' RNA ligase